MPGQPYDATFSFQGILLSIDGVNRFRTVEDLLRADVDLGKAFESALRQLETRQSECEFHLGRHFRPRFDLYIMFMCYSPPPDSEESRKQLNDILMKRKESLAELRQRIAQSTLRPEDLRINRPPYRKTSDLFASEYLDMH